VSDPATVEAAAVVIAAGCGSAALTGLPIRPVKGEIVRLRGTHELRHVVRGFVDGRVVYLVPRTDGELVVGATMDERRDPVVTVGAVLDLLAAAVDLIPAVAEYELAETQVGFRPGTPDNAPMIGPWRPGIIVASGHYRNGITLAPVTADAVADLLTGGGPSAELVAPFSPHRFAASGGQP
jgi:glycine oxidase